MSGTVDPTTLTGFEGSSPQGLLVAFSTRSGRNLVEEGTVLEVERPDSILKLASTRQLVPLDDPLAWMFIDALSAIRDLPFEYSRAWQAVNGPPPLDPRWSWDSVEPGLAYVSFNPWFTVILTFAKQLVDVPGWIDGFAKLIAYVGGFPDLVKTHQFEVKTKATQAETAYERALADAKVQRIENELRLSRMNAVAVDYGNIQRLEVRAQEIKNGH